MRPKSSKRMNKKNKLQKSKNFENSPDGAGERLISKNQQNINNEEDHLSERDDLSESCTEEEDGNDNDDLDDEDEDDDFVCVPMSNIDKDTMTFKNSEKLKISVRGTDRLVESARKCDS